MLHSHGLRKRFARFFRHGLGGAKGGPAGSAGAAARESELAGIIPTGWREFEALESRLMMAAQYTNRALFEADPAVLGLVDRIDFEAQAAGTDLTNVSLGNVRLEAPGSGPLSVINALAGVRAPMTAPSGARILSPGGSDPSLQNDDLRIVFDIPVSAAGLDVIFDVPDGASFTSITFRDAAGAVLTTINPIPAPGGAPGNQFVGYVANGALIKSIVIDEFDDSAGDDNIAFDDLTWRTVEATALKRVTPTASQASPVQPGFASAETYDGVASVWGGIGGISDNGWASNGLAGDIFWQFPTPTSVDRIHLFVGDEGSPTHDIGAFNLYYTTDAAPGLAGSWTAVPGVSYVPGVGTPGVAGRIAISGNEIRMNATGAYESSHTGVAGSVVNYQLDLSGLPRSTTGLRLEAVEAAGMPGNGPGGGTAGNFVLTEMQFFATAVAEPAPTEDSVLFVNVNGASYNGDGTLFFNTVTAAGARTTFVNLSSSGLVASLIALNHFDQVWVFDLSSGTDGYTPDWNAIGDWYKAGRAAGENYQIIADGRIISSYWQGRNATEGTKLSRNYYTNLRDNGGGLFLGTDHDAFHAGINSINSRININPFVGNFSLTFIPVDTTHPLMTTPNNMGTQLFDDSSPGQTPFGLQPNGQILYTVAWHSGNVNTPGISSTISGTIGFHVDITGPTPGSNFLHEAPVTFTATRTNGTGPFTYSWSSNRDGQLGTGASLTVSNLSLGQHVITLLGQDQGGGGADSETVTLTILPVADLSVSGLTGPAVGQPGAQIAVGWLTTNEGSAAAAAFTDKLYLSTDNVLDGADIPLNTAMLPALGIGGASQVNLMATLPEVADGLYHLLAEANTGSAIQEAVRANNVAGRTIQIDRAPSLVSFEPHDLWSLPVNQVTLNFSEELNEAAAEAAGGMTLIHLGADRMPGTGDETTHPVTATYSAGVKRITLAAQGNLPDGDYQLRIHPGTSGAGVMDGAGQNMDSDGDHAPDTGDFIVGFTVDTTGPQAVSASAASGLQIQVNYSDINGMNAASISQAANYTLHRSGGDGTFGEANDVDVTGLILSASATGAMSLQALLALSGELAPEVYRLTLNAAGIMDAVGNPLNGGVNQTLSFSFTGGPASAVSVDLVAGSDSGASSSDDITNDSTPTFDVTVSRAGRVELDYTNDGVVDFTFVASAPGTYQATSGALVDGGRTTRARLIPAAGSTVESTLGIVIDTVRPTLLAGTANETAPWSARLLTFSEPIDPATITTADVTLNGPNMTNLGAAASLAGAGAAWTAGFGPFTEPGNYRLNVGPNLSDIAGNAMLAAAADNVVLDPDTSGPYVVSFTPQGVETESVSTARVVFNEAILQSSFTGADVLISGPGGPVSGAAVTVVKVNDTTYDLNFAAQSLDGDYSVTIGPSITDLSGNVMGQGGTQLLYSTDFQGAVDPVWNNTQLVNYGVTTQFMGQFDNHTITLTLPNLPAHTMITLVWDLMILDSWDGNNGPGPDYWGFNVTGAASNPVFEHTFTTFGGVSQTFPGSPDVLGQFPGTSGNWQDSIYESISRSFAHTGSTLQISFYGRNLQGVGDEGWGIDDVRVFATTVQEAGFTTGFTIDRTGPRATVATPGALENQPLDHIDVTFDAPILASSLTAEDVTLTGPLGAIAIAGIAAQSPTVYRVSFAPQQAGGVYDLSVGPNVTDAAGNAMDQDQDFSRGEPVQDVFRHTVAMTDTQGPFVTAFTPTGPVNVDVASARVTFNEPIDFASFSVSDIVITGPGGVVIAGGVSVTPVGPGVFDILFPTQSAEGEYEVRVGPFIQDIAGNAMVGVSRDYSTILTFEPAVLDNSVPSQNYGDRVVTTSQGGFFYDTGGVQPLTPNVTVEYGPNLRTWQGGYGDLTNIIWTETGIIEITLTADAGFQAGLFGFDLAGWPQADYTINGVQVLDGSGATLFSQANVLVQGDGVGPRRTPIVFDVPLVSPTLVIRVDSRNLGGGQDNIGIDNIEFAQFASGVVDSLAFTGLFSIDKMAPAVQSVGPQVTTGTSLDHLDVTFSEAMKASTLAAGDFSLMGPAGAVPITGLTVLSSDSVRLHFAARSTDGFYTLQSGPNITDLAGNPMSGIHLSQVEIRQPDLAPIEIRTNLSGVFGSAIAVGWTVRNNGDVPTAAAAWVDRVWLSSDTTVGADDLLLESPFDGSMALIAGGVYDRDLMVTLPLRTNLPDGEYYILVQTDAAGQQPESNEGDNTLAQAIHLSIPNTPDLVVTQISAPATAKAGQQIQVTWQVKNEGDAAASGIWDDQVLLSLDGVIGGDTLMTTTPFVGTILPGDFVTRQATITLPFNLDADRWVVIRTDATNLINELSNDNNNTSIDDVPIDVSFPPLPDLRALNVDFGGGALSGQPLTISWTVANEGTAATGGNWVDRLVLRNLTTGQTILTQDLAYNAADAGNGAISAGSQRSRQLTITLPEGANGVGNLEASVTTDFTNVIFENKEGVNAETNNTGVGNIVSSGGPVADLRVTNVTPPVDAAWSGRSVIVSWTVMNEGTRPTGSNWLDGVYLSSDGAIGGDILLGRLGNPTSLGTGGAYTRSGTFTLPEDISGIYQLVVRANDTQALYEEDAADNGAISGPFTVNLTPEPDLTVTSVTTGENTVPAGGVVHVEWAVKNIGTGATNAPYWHDQVYLSADTTLDGGDILLSPQQLNPQALAANESYGRAVDFVIPGNLFGEYYILVMTDRNVVMAELIETNNVGVSAEKVTIEPVLPAILSVVDVSVVPPSLWSGDQATVQWRIENTGGLSTGSIHFDHTIVLSVDGTLNIPGDRTLVFHVANVDVNLDPGEKSALLTATVTIPTDVLPGVYNLLPWPDPPQFTGLGKNVIGAPFTVEQGVPSDLVVDSVTIPATGTAGFGVSISWVGRNASAQSTRTGSWFDQVIFSKDDSALTTGDNFILGGAHHSGALDFDETYTQGATVNLPTSFSGTYHVFVKTDSNNQVLEGEFDANNTTRAMGTINVANLPADFVVTQAVYTLATNAGSGGVSGSEVEISWTLRNIGVGASPASGISTRFWLSDDDTLDAGDRILADASIGIGSALAPGGAGTTVTRSFHLPADYTSPSMHILVQADVSNATQESNEGNNLRVAVESTGGGATTPISPPPTDLQMLSAMARLAPGSTSLLNVNWTVRNNGAQTAAPGWLDSIYLSPDPFLNPGQDLLLGQFTHSGSLGYGASYVNSVNNLALPEGLAGRFYIFVKTDASEPGRVNESNENNNVGSSLVENVVTTPGGGGPAGLADLDIIGMVISPTAISGQSTSVSWTVRNIGDAATLGDNWRDSIYLSLDQFFDGAGDIFLGSLDRVGALGAGGQYTGMLNVQLPRGLSGPYYLLVRTNTNLNTPESNPFNNTQAGDSALLIELAEPTDLTVDGPSINGPANAIIGLGASFSWTVRNMGESALGSWRDAVYLSLDQTLDIGDVKLGEVTRTGPLADNGQYTGSLNATLPGMLPGDYYVLVRTDVRDEVRETMDGQLNNTSASLGRVHVDAQQIAPDSMTNGTLAMGQSVYYRVNLAAGEALKLTLDSSSSSASNEMYVRFGGVPTRGLFDLASEDPFASDSSFLVPANQSGTYYILLYGSNVIGAPAFTLKAELLPFSILGAAPGDIGQSGEATLAIDGARFDGSTGFEMISPNGTVVRASAVYLESSIRAYATFDLDGKQAGLWDLRAFRGDGLSDVELDAVSVSMGMGSHVFGRITGPGLVRAGRLNSMVVNFGNNGDVDMAPPLLVIESATGTPMGLAGDSLASGVPVHLYGLPDDGPVDIMRPHSAYNISMFYSSTTENLSFNVRKFTETTTVLITDWSAIETSIRPTGLTDDQWQPFWTQIQSRIGSTWGDYVRALRTMHQMVALPGETIRDVRELFGRVFGFDAEFKPAAMISGVLRDSESGVAIAGAKVDAVDDQGVPRGSAVTDPLGRFELPYLLDGAYSLNIAEGFFIDQDRDGTQDATLPSYILTHAQDLTGISLFARTMTPPEAIQTNIAPSLAVDSSGRAHMAWTRGNKIVHSWFDGTRWTEPVELPEAIGAEVQLTASDHLIDGTQSGLLATWQSGSGNGAELYYAVGRETGPGVYEWTLPTALTSDDVSDSNASVLVRENGQIVVVDQKANFGIEDDTDLYYQTLLIDGSQLQYPVVALPIIGGPEAGNLDAKFLVGVSVSQFVDIPSQFPIIGGRMGVGGSDAQEGTASKTSAQVTFPGVELEQGVGDFAKLKAQLSGSFSWACDPEDNKFHFKFGSVTLTGGAELEIPLILIPIPYILGYASAGVVGTYSASGSANWSEDNPFPSASPEYQGQFQMGGGVFGKIEALFGLIEGKVSGTFNVSTTISKDSKVNSASVKLEAEASGPFFKMQGSWEWVLAMTPVGGAGLIASESLEDGAYSLGDGMFIVVDPLTGTGGVYGTHSVLADVSGDYYNDGPMAMAEGPGAQVLGAWAKDGDVSVGDFGHIAVSQFDGTDWGAPATIPGTNAMNNDVDLAFDAQGDALALWRRADMTGLGMGNSAQELYEATLAGDIVYSVRGAGGQWSTPGTELALTNNDVYPSLGTAASGNLIATWVNSDGATERLMAAEWDGDSWGTPDEVSSGPAGSFAGEATVAVVGGRTVIFWTADVDPSPDSSNFQIRSSVLSDGWSPAQGFDPMSDGNFFTNLAVTETGGMTMVTEGGATDSVSIVLTSAPTADVIVHLTTGPQIAVSGPVDLVFTESNWNVPRIVTLAAVDDAAIEGTQTDALSFSLQSQDDRYDGRSVKDVKVTVKDNEKGRVQIVESQGNTTISEDGLSDSYTVALLDRPEADVTVHLQHDGQTNPMYLPLIFTTENWNQPQTVTVIAVDDAAVEGLHTGLLRHSTSSSDPRFQNVPVADVTATILDNEDGRVLISGIEALNEATPEVTRFYSIRLMQRPLHPVIVTPVPADDQVTLAGFQSLLFTSEDWDVERLVEVAVVDDDIAEGLHIGRIHHLVFSADPLYDAATAPDLVAGIFDDDFAGIVVESPDGVNEVTEGEDSDTYTIRLTSEPRGPVTIDIFTDGQTTTSPQTVTFGPGSWSTPMTISVRAPLDLVLEGDRLSFINHRATSVDPAYNGRPSGTAFLVHEGLTGAPGVAILESEGRTDVEESGATDTYKIVLTGEPLFPVTVTTIVTDGQTTASGSASFGPDNWDQPQEITVTAIDEGENEGPHTGFIGHQVSSGDPRYDGMLVRGVVAHIKDFTRINDSARIPVSGGGGGGGAGGFGGPPDIADCDDEPPYEPEPVSPIDPNDILGPDGFGEQRWLNLKDDLDFTIRFENMATAEAPAQEVIIRQQLDDDLDWKTFRVGDFGWASHYFGPSSSRPNYFRRIDLTATEGFYVDVQVGIDIQTGVVTWRFTTLDPTTGDKPLEALTGFLATNNAEGIGEGFVKYSIRPRPDADTRNIVDSEATIVFDTEGPIDTPPIFNTLDGDRPASEVTDLPASLPSAQPIVISWTGGDGDGSGVAFYDLYISRNGGAFELLAGGLTETSYEFAPELGDTYAFFTRATDNVGNVEAAPTTPDTTTTVGRQGDFNADGVIDDADIDLLMAAIAETSTDGQFDLTGDGDLDSLDTDRMIRVILNTEYGDANLDGQVSVGDLVLLAESFDTPGGWAQGDFNGDGVISLGDLVLLGANFGLVAPVIGDINGDREVDAADIDRLQLLIRAGATDENLDLNDDGAVNQGDVDLLVRDILDAEYGDANLDGTVGLGDLTLVAGNVNQPGGWAMGDFNGDGVVSVGDLILLSENFQTGGGLSGLSASALIGMQEDEEKDKDAEAGAMASQIADILAALAGEEA